MGNVQAYSAPPPPPPPGVAFPKSKESDVKASEEVTIENPGPLEEIHTKCKSEFMYHNLYLDLNVQYPIIGLKQTNYVLTVLFCDF